MLSCGIPTSYYVEPAVVNKSESTNSILVASVNKDSSTKYSFLIYARYFNKASDDRDFTKTNYEDSNLGSNQYLVNRGFAIVDIESGVILSSSYSVTDESTIKISTVDNKQVVFTIHENIYNLKLNYKNEYSHYIGSFLDDEGEKFLIKFAKDQISGNISGDIDKLENTIYVEFAIVAKDLDTSSVISHESIPVYLGSLHIQRRQ